MNNFLSVSVIVFALVGCENRSGLSEYAKAMSFCVTMDRYFKEYEKEFHVRPVGTDLKKYLKNNGISENLMKDWFFGAAGEKYVAYNINVKTRSGSYVTIIFYNDGKYETLGL